MTYISITASQLFDAKNIPRNINTRNILCIHFRPIYLPYYSLSGSSIINTKVLSSEYTSKTFACIIYAIHLRISAIETLICVSIFFLTITYMLSYYFVQAYKPSSSFITEYPCLTIPSMIFSIPPVTELPFNK